jgi:hypothetical protein
MRVFNRGADVAFTFTFYDSSGDITSPSSAYCKIAYPGEYYPLINPQMETTTVALTQNSTTLVYEGSWQSGVSYPGTIFYHIRSEDLSWGVDNGEFQLRGNPANLSITTTST